MSNSFRPPEETNIGSANIGTGAVTNPKLAADAVTTDKISDGTIVNADISTSAAIALSKLATTTVSRALTSNSSGVITPATTTDTEIGYVNGVTSSIQTQLNARLTSGNVVNADINASAAISPSKIADDNYSYVAGRFYMSNHLANPLAAMTVTANRFYAVPFACRSAHTFVEIGIAVTTGVNGAKIRIGIFTDSSGVPGSLVVDSGEFVCSGVGAQNATGTISTPLTKGVVYWLVFISDSAVLVDGAGTGGVVPWLGSSAYTDTRDYIGGFAASTYGALSGLSPFPSITMTNGVCPAVKLKA